VRTVDPHSVSPVKKRSSTARLARASIELPERLVEGDEIFIGLAGCGIASERPCR